MRKAAGGTRRRHRAAARCCGFRAGRFAGTAGRWPACTARCSWPCLGGREGGSGVGQGRREGPETGGQVGPAGQLRLGEPTGWQPPLGAHPAASEAPAPHLASLIPPLWRQKQQPQQQAEWPPRRTKVVGVRAAALLGQRRGAAHHAHHLQHRRLHRGTRKTHGRQGWASQLPGPAGCRSRNATAARAARARRRHPSPGGAPRTCGAMPLRLTITTPSSEVRSFSVVPSRASTLPTIDTRLPMNCGSSPKLTRGDGAVASMPAMAARVGGLLRTLARSKCGGLSLLVKLAHSVLAGGAAIRESNSSEAGGSAQQVAQKKVRCRRALPRPLPAAATCHPPAFAALACFPPRSPSCVLHQQHWVVCMGTTCVLPFTVEPAAASGGSGWQPCARAAAMHAATPASVGKRLPEPAEDLQIKQLNTLGKGRGQVRTSVR